MKEDFLWQEKLDLFDDVFCSIETREELVKWVESGNSAECFKPGKCFTRRDELSAPDLDNLEAGGNAYYHLNGRNLLGIERKWIEQNGRIKNGIALNSGEITIDHSSLTDRFLSKIFLEVHSREELINTVKELLNLSNEEIVKRFNIKGTKSDLANLFNAIVLDPIISYEIERGNFKRYGRGWADSQLVCAVSKSGERYTVSSLSTNDFEILKPMELLLPNGESVIFKLNFIEKDDTHSYTLDDISTEILEIKGDSELLKTSIKQIGRFSVREQSGIGDEGEKTTDDAKEERMKKLADKKAELMSIYNEIHQPRDIK